MSSYRELELLVMRIEGALAPAGARIRSPDHIADIFTGELREVDVSIRHRLGSVTVLITVECRDRTRAEDVTWIEQLATKQKHIGAAHTIAVSSTGFSAPAIKAAKLHGISTRIIGELSDADILDWLDILQIEEVETSCQLGRLRLEYEGDHPGAHIDPTLEQEWFNRGFDAKIFLERATGSLLSLVELIRRAGLGKARRLGHRPGLVTVAVPPQSSVSFSDDPLAILAHDVPADGSSVNKMSWIEVTEKEISMTTTVGILILKKIGFEITMSSSRRRVPASRVVSYSDDEKGIVDVAEHQFDHRPGGGSFVITQHRVAAKRPERSK